MTQLEDEQTATESSIAVFDFDMDWKLVRPHLHRPEVEQALNRGMTAYRAMRARLCSDDCPGPNLWQLPYCAEQGPLSCDSTDYWLYRTETLLEAAISNGTIKFDWPEENADEKTMEDASETYSALQNQFYPKPDTLEWYQLSNAAHYLAPWLLELGKCVYPKLEWRVMIGDQHSLVYATDAIGSISMLFDILYFRWPAIDLLELTTRKQVGPPSNWTEELCARPNPPLFV